MKTLEKYWTYIVIFFAIFMFVKPVVCLLILGFIFSFIGVHYLSVVTNLKNFGLTINGKISKYSRDGKGYQTPVIKYTTFDGKIIENEPYIFSTSDLNKITNFKNQIDKTIVIRYNSQNPDEFLLQKQVIFTKVISYFFTIFGIVITTVGIVDIFGFININFK
ncbi:MAG: DUF3592 domain-containing protein [Weeksellaceae bacterium]|nr:DUF3592 domain-containing protein [Weeksellaceae bacterium]